MRRSADNPLVRRGRASLWFLVAAFLPLTVFGVMTLVLWNQERVAARQLERKLAPIRAAGLPIGDAALAKRFRDSSSTVGTDAWSRISMLCMSYQWDGVGSLPVVGAKELPARIDPDTAWADDEPVGEYLAAVRPIIDLIHRSTEVPKPVWQPIEFRGISTLLPELQNARQIARILRLESEHALFHGDADRALRAIESLRATAEVYDWHLFLVGELVNIALRHIHLDIIARSLSVDLWSEDQVAALLASLRAPLPIAEKWRACLAAEQLMAIASLENPAGLAGTGLPTAQSLWITPRAKLQLYNAYDQLQSLADAGADRLLERARHWEETFARTNQSDDLGLRGLFLPAITNFAELLGRTTDRRKITLTAVAIKQFQLTHDQWPGTLDELIQVGLTPADWTLRQQGPLGYEINEEGAEIFCYSVNRSDKKPSNPTVIRREPGVAYDTILVR